MDSSRSTQQTILYADREHRGIQFAIPLIILAACAGVFFLADPLILQPFWGGDDFGGYRALLRLVLSLVLGLAIGGLVESLLWRVWRSGRQLCVDASCLVAVDRNKSQQAIHWDKRVNLLLWQYALRGYARGGRERRVPTSHSLYACRLLQDEDVIIAFSYLSPKQQRDLIEPSQFVELDMELLKRPGTSKRPNPLERPRIPPTLLTGKHGQLWTAEKERWQVGLELDPSDYAVLMGEMARHGILPPLY